VVTLAAADDAEGTLVRVLDGGGGIPAALREAIFEPFVQLGSGSEPPSTRTGRGLGLAFCKLVAGAHGGTIWVEDNAPGAVFCLRLPRVG
jgi:signal transduction histidine kinase